MNELTRRMTRCGLTRVAARGMNPGYIGVPKQQPCRLLSTIVPRSINTPSAISSTPQRIQFSTDIKNEDVLENLKGADSIGKVISDPSSGEQFGMLLDTRKLPKLKPSIVRRRLSKCKTYVGQEKGIRQSPWKLNRICQLAAGLTLEEALTQLKFCSLKNADLVAKVLKRTSNLADIRDGIQMSQLEVAECFATKAMMLRRIKMMGRGRSGVMHHKFSHIRIVLREIDFPLRIYQQKSLNQKKKWLQHQHRAEKDAQAAKAKRGEMERLMRQEEEQSLSRKAAAAEAK